MVSDWVSLSEVCEIRRGSSPRPIVNFTSEITGMPWVKIADATADESRYITKTNQFIKPEGVSKSVIVEKGDLILSNSGTAGLPKFMGITACIHDGWQVLKNLDGITSEYLYYSLIHIRPFLLHHAYDSVMKNLTLDMVRNARIKLPPLPEQKAIAHILGSLDDKIELNRQMNETLEAMAQALFKSWFVDFDPVIDNVLAAGKPIPDEFIERAEQREGIEKKDNADIQSLFPDEFEFTEEMGWIPKGWSVQSFSELAVLDTTSVKPNLKPDKIWEHFSIPAFDIDMSPVFDKGEDIKSNKYKVDANAVLVSKLNPETERIWWVNIQDEESAICSTEFMQFIPVNSKYRAFIYSLVRSDYFQTEILSRVTGSTGSRQRAQPKSVAAIDILKPEEDVLIHYSNIVLDWKLKVSVNIDQNLKLAKLRDTLLPKLMSGELRIPDADAMTKEV